MPRATRSSKDRILDAAERLFARRGFHAVSVRTITGAAKVDLALVNYHFGTKRELLSAVFARRGEILNLERLERIDAVIEAAKPGQPTIRALVDAFLDPVLERAGSGDAGWRNYFALVAYVNNSPEWGKILMSAHFDPVVRKLIAAIAVVAPAAPLQELYWAYHFLTGSLTLSLAQTGRLDKLSGGLCRSSDLVSVHDRLGRYAAAGFAELCEATSEQEPGVDFRVAKRQARSKRASAAKVSTA